MKRFSLFPAILLLVCGWLYPHFPAFAASPVQGDVCSVPSSQTTCDRQQAWDEANDLQRITAYCRATLGQATGVITAVTLSDPSTYRRSYACKWTVNNTFAMSGETFHSFKPCAPGTAWNESTHTCDCPTGQIRNVYDYTCREACSARPSFTTGITSSTGQAIPNGAIGCRDGCMYLHTINGDGTATGTYLGDDPDSQCAVAPVCLLPGWYLSIGTGMCHPPPPKCSASQRLDPKTNTCINSCPSGMTLDATGACIESNNTCPAGQVKAPDGSCIDDSCPSGQVKGSDGSCKRSNDPNKDQGDNDKYFSGGDSCSAPPACSGDPILCGQARIQWRIDCNTRRNLNVSGGSCDAVPICTGEKCDALEYAQLLQQWRAACALERMAPSRSSDPGQDTSDKQPSWTRVDGMNQDPGAGQTSDDIRGVRTKTISTDSLDASGWLGGVGSCPSLVSGAASNGIGAAFAQSLASPPAWFCNFIGAMAAIIMTIASVAAGYILSRG